MQNNYKKMQNLFLRQSYLDAWEDYERSLRKPSFIRWDMIILTASNEAQAEAYRQQINYRIENGLLPKQIHFAVLPDPDGKRVGSGGATFNVLKYIAENDENYADVSGNNPFENKRILVIHSGGDSKRVPQYSACGKLFSPVPRELPNGNASTLFDEFMISMSGVPSRIREGMLVLSGDVLLLFNPLQIDFQFDGAAAISIKEHVDTGKNHGVFLNDGNDYVGSFLHKQSEETLRACGAVNKQDCVDLDTGAVMLDANLLQALYTLISSNNKVDGDKFNEFVNEKSRISFYGDFLYPLAKESTLEKYLKEAPEGSFCVELEECRKKIWAVLHEFSMKLLCLAPAEFIHFGTTRELIELVTDEVDNYEFLDWKKNVVSNITKPNYAVHNSFISENATVGDDCYIENSIISGNVVIGEKTVISDIELENKTGSDAIVIPSGIVIHGIILSTGKYVARIYGINDNPKNRLEDDASFLGTTLNDFIYKNNLSKADVWENDDTYLWFANIYPVCNTMPEAVNAALSVYRMSCEKAGKDEIDNWKNSTRLSLYSSFNTADVQAVIPWKKRLTDMILVDKFMKLLENGVYFRDSFDVFGNAGISDYQYTLLMEKASEEAFGIKIRIYYYLSRYMKQTKTVFEGESYDSLEKMCFETIQNVISQHNNIYQKDNEGYKIVEDEVNINLPIRVNWGGGWTDTPPYCNECGGVVLNAALTLNGERPVCITVRRLDEFHIEFESQDVGVHGYAKTVEEILDCHNPYDSFALHKAALIACGVISPSDCHTPLQEILKRLGGGIYISTQVKNVPKGSGLGTSSILAGACVKGIFKFLGRELSNAQIYDTVLCMEQIMSTGGGWQDQVGGLTDGIKFITSTPGIKQEINVEKIIVPEKIKKELDERFALIYTGQRRLARNLLREVVGNYIGNRPESIDALHKMKRLAVLMKFELQHGSIEGFTNLLNSHWELSKQLDAGSTNTCIDQIFVVCEDLIDGRFISGAGGGGFLQVILKKGVTKEQLRQRLKAVFQDSGVDVWECELV